MHENAQRDRALDHVEVGQLIRAKLDMVLGNDITTPVAINEFEKAGFECPSIKENNRKLIFENPEKGVRYFWVKPSDVAIYVERGAADIGVAGKDILLEYEPDVYELLDLKTGICRMAVAAREDFRDDPPRPLKVATKFKNIARNYYT